MSEYIQFQQATRVESIERLKNSVNGNPRFKVSFTNGVLGVTKNDAGFAYSIHAGMGRVLVSYHFTASAKCIIDDITEIQGQ
jgi:hypothetical protein